MKTLLPLLAVLALAAAPDDDADRKALRGEWKAVRGGVALNITIARSFTFTAKGPNVNLDGERFAFAIQKEDGKTIIELDRRSAEVAGIPAKIPYRLVEDTLHLTMVDGSLQGQWQLERVKK